MASYTSGGKLKTSIVIDPELRSRVNEIATQLGVSKSAALRLVVIRGLQSFLDNPTIELDIVTPSEVPALSAA